MDECSCRCHWDKKVNHISACCFLCKHCGSMIDIYMHDRHLEECKDQHLYHEQEERVCGP